MVLLWHDELALKEQQPYPDLNRHSAAAVTAADNRGMLQAATHAVTC